MRPSTSLLAQLRAELVRHTPFDHMDAAALDFFICQSQQQYFAPDEVLISPADGPVQHLYLIRQGAVTGTHGLADWSGGAFQYEEGDLFPAGAAIGQRAVTESYQATQDTFVLALPLSALRELMEMSAPFADFMNRRVMKFLELSERALQVAFSSRTLAEQSLETPLGEVARAQPAHCAAGTPLREALVDMHRRRIGSMLVTDERAAPVGILTRHDILGRVTLAGVSLDTPIGEVMVQPVLSLAHDRTAQDAALLMGRHGVRHVPVTRDGVLVGIVSERDLFAMQRMSLKHVSSLIRAATTLQELKPAAEKIREFARSLLGQGVRSRQVTALISHLNDVFTLRLLEIVAASHDVDLRRLCWLALGSEGRGEQTIATDQDNALILPDDCTAAQRSAAQDFAQAANLALDACGYPLCKGGIMAGQAQCCMTLAQWRLAFAQWIEHGGPEDLLNASIFFDLRGVAGDESMAQALRAEITASASASPRFQKQLALNALTRTAPLDWRGAIAVDHHGTVDLKLQGSAIFVDAARLYSLAHGIAVTGTRERLEAVGSALGVPADETQTWVGAFDFLQGLRLQVQLDPKADPDQPNRIALASLNALDRRMLKESFRVARSIGQRMRLDYER